MTHYTVTDQTVISRHPCQRLILSVSNLAHGLAESESHNVAVTDMICWRSQGDLAAHIIREKLHSSIVIHVRNPVP